MGGWRPVITGGWETVGVLFVDPVVSWLVFILAEGGRKKLTSLILGNDPERALRPAARAAVQATAAELCPNDPKQAAEELAIMINPLFEAPPPGAPLGEQETVLQALQMAIAEQLRLLEDPGLTETLKSLTGMPDVSAKIVAQKLTGHLVQEIVVRGSRGGPLAPLASQLNHDRTYLQGQRIEGQGQRSEGMLAQLLDWLGGGLTAPASAAGPAGSPLAEVADPFALEVHRPVDLDVPQPELPVLPEYVPRDHDAALAEVVTAAAAGTSGIAVLVGGSSTGKTRACWEALELLRDVEPGWRLWHPIDQKGAVAGLPGAGPRTVVWLNEAQRYLDTADATGERVAAGLRELLRERGRGPVLVLPTLWPDYWAELTVRPPGGADPHAQARELLTGHDIPVPAKFDDDQLRKLVKAGDPRLAQAAAGSRDGRVIQYLAGAPELLDRYQTATPAARALIDAAMDAARLGMRSALPRAFLEAAAPGYLTDTEWDLLPGDWLEQALDYTASSCKGVRGPLAPIRPRPGVQANSGEGPAWQLADYLDQHGRCARREKIPPEGFWAAAASYADPADLFTLAGAAEDRGLYCDAAGLYKQASAHGDPEAGARLVRLLHILHPGDQRPADWAAAHASLDDPYAVATLLHALLDAGATGPVATLLDRDPAAYASLDNPQAVTGLLGSLADLGDPAAATGLLGALRQAGAASQVTALLDRAATHASLDNPISVIGLLGALHSAGTDAQVTTLATRAVAHASLDNPHAVAWLLGALREAGAVGQVTTLATRAVAHASLDNPHAVAKLLNVLREAGATDQVTTLATRVADHASLDNPDSVIGLLGALREAGAADQVTTLLDRDPAAHARLHDPAAVGGLLDALREAGAADQVTTLLDRDPAAHASLHDPAAVGGLLDALGEAGAADQVTRLLDRDPAAHARLDYPAAVGYLLHALREAGATDQVTTLATRAADHVRLDDPAAVGYLLHVLREAGAADQVALLDRDPAAHARLDDPAAVAKLLGALREAGATDQVTTLATRAADHASLANPDAVIGLLIALHSAGATGQITTLATRAATHTSLDDTVAVAGLMEMLPRTGATGQITTLLTRDPAAHASLANPHAVTALLYMLRITGATGQVTALATRAAAHTSLDDPAAVAKLLDMLREAGATNQVTTLATRAAAHTSLDSSHDAAVLLDALRKAGARAQAAELIERLPAAGLFQLFCRQEGRADQFRFGRQADGHPARRWAWTDLD